MRNDILSGSSPMLKTLGGMPAGVCRVLFLLVLLSLLIACAKKPYKKTDDEWWDAPKKATLEAQASYPSVTVESRYLTMRDGVKIAVDIYLPEGLKKGEKIPAILQQTRYGRDFAYKWPFNKILKRRFQDTINPIVKSGYAWIFVDTRGTGASFGRRSRPYSEDEVQDGVEIVDWIINEPWSNGAVGLWGNSYDGGAALMLAAKKHPNVLAVMPRFAMFDAYSEVFFPGGVQLVWLLNVWSSLAKALDKNDIAEFLGAHVDIAIKGLKPVDDDPDGRLLAQAVKEHESNGSIKAIAEHVIHRDDPIEALGGKSIDELSPHQYIDDINESKAVVYAYTGWADASFLLSEVHLYMNLEDERSRLTIGPWDHGGYNHVSPYVRGSKTAFDNVGEIKRFFDRYLKGRKNGIEKESSVHYFTMGEEKWKSAQSWPPEGTEKKTFYLAENRRLLADKARAKEKVGKDAYEVFPRATTGKKTRWESLVNLDHDAVFYGFRKMRDRKLLVYESAPLKEAMEVTGHPVVSLLVEAAAKDLSLFVYLEDVNEQGAVRYVTEGMLRALHRKLSSETPPYKTPVPYRTFKKKDAEALTPNEPAEMVFDLYPVSYLFKKGHKIRIAISGADREHFKTIPGGKTEIKLHYGKPDLSYLTLPVMPR